MTFNVSPGDSSDSMRSVSSGVFSIAGVQVKATIGSSFITDVIRVEKMGVDNAIKILTPGGSADLDLRSRFSMNARYNQSLSEFTQMPIADIVENTAQPYYVMERVSESSLLEVIRHHAPIDPEWLLNLLLPISRSLDTIHQRNVLHANIKPSNLLVVLENNEEKFLLVDYLEPSLMATSATLTGAGVYAAPEFRAGMPVSNRSDVYSIGACVYESLSGNVPSGPYRTKDGSYHVWRSGMGVPELSRVNPELSRGLSDIVMNAISPQPISRQATVSNFVEEALRTLEQPRSKVKVEPVKNEHAPVPMILIAMGVFLCVMLLFGGYALVKSIFSTKASPTPTPSISVATSKPDDGALTQGEIQLLKHLPTKNQDCGADRSIGKQRRWPSAQAIIYCKTSQLSFLSYGLFEDSKELDTVYKQEAQVLKTEVEQAGGEVVAIGKGVTPCSSSANTSGEWNSKNMGGKFTCVSQPSPKIIWTENSTGIIGEAQSSASINDLITWWLNDSGPV